MNRFGCLALLLGCGVLLGAAAGPGYAAIGAQDTPADRTVSTSEVAPGETVTVTTTVQLDSEATVNLADEFDPGFESVELVSVQLDGENVSTLIESVESDGVVAAFDPLGPGELVFTYELTVPADAQAGTSYAFDGLVEVGDNEYTIGGDSEIAVGGSTEFVVTADATQGTVTAGEEATIEYTVENTGSAENTQTLSFTVGGTEEDTEEITLAGGETTTGSFSYATTTADTPEVELGVGGADDRATVTVTVESGSDDGGSDDGGSDDGGSDDGGSDDGGSDDGGSDDGGSDDGGSDDGGDSDGSGPGFGLVAAFGAAALLTAYSLRRAGRED